MENSCIKCYLMHCDTWLITLSTPSKLVEKLRNKTLGNEMVEIYNSLDKITSKIQSDAKYITNNSHVITNDRLLEIGVKQAIYSSNNKSIERTEREI